MFTNEKVMVTNLSYLLPLGNSESIFAFNLMCYVTLSIRRQTTFDIDMMKDALSNFYWASILDPLDINDTWLSFKSTVLF